MAVQPRPLWTKANSCKEFFSLHLYDEENHKDEHGGVEGANSDGEGDVDGEGKSWQKN